MNRPMIAIKRLQKELSDLINNTPGNISASPIDESDWFNWRGLIVGDKETPFHGGNFFLNIEFPQDYPFRPPRVKFITKIYHPNINSIGGISISILDSDWSPALNISEILKSVSSLITDPNPSDPLMPGIAKEYQEDRAKFNAKVREWVREYAM